MKKMLLSMLTACIVLTASAQQENLSEKFYNAKLAEVTQRLNITDAQKDQFNALYKQYNDDMRATFGKREKHEKPTTAKEAAELLNKRLDRQEKAIGVRRTYIDKFAKVLDADQLTRLFSIENQMQRKVMDRRNRQGMGKGDGQRMAQRKGMHGNRRQGDASATQSTTESAKTE